jgi:hypothetical protein
MRFFKRCRGKHQEWQYPKAVHLTCVFIQVMYMQKVLIIWNAGAYIQRTFLQHEMLHQGSSQSSQSAVM